VLIGIDNPKLNLGGLVDIALEEIGGTPIFPFFEKGVDFEVLLESPDHFDGLRRKAKDLGLCEIPPEIVAGVQEVYQDENGKKNDGIGQGMESV
jgi:hypothetical protein